jgi:hypothetical protein
MRKKFGIVLKAIALAMGIVLIVIPTIGTISYRTGFILAGIGIFSIAFESFLKYTYGLHK